MKAVIKTQYLHTINFFTASYQAERGLAGLDMLLSYVSKKELKFDIKKVSSFNLSDTLTNIMPEPLDDLSYERINTVLETGMLEPMDIRLLLQWLVNKEILPSGSYKVLF